MPSKHKKNPIRNMTNGARKTITMPRSAAKAPRAGGLSQAAMRGLMIGAATVAGGAAATGAVLMRRSITKGAADAAAQAMAVGHSLGTYGTRFGRMIGDRVDLESLLTSVGLKRRPSLLRRLLPPMGAIAALLVAAGSAALLLAPKLAAAAAKADRKEPERATDTMKANASWDVNSVSNSIHDHEDTTAHADR